MSRMCESVGSRALGGRCGSNELMPMVFNAHRHLVADFRCGNGDAVGGADVGFTLRATMWMDWNMCCSCEEGQAWLRSPSYVRRSPLPSDIWPSIR